MHENSDQWEVWSGVSVQDEGEVGHGLSPLIFGHSQGGHRSLHIQWWRRKLFERIRIHDVTIDIPVRGYLGQPRDILRAVRGQNQTLGSGRLLFLLVLLFFIFTLLLLRCFAGGSSVCKTGKKIEESEEKEECQN